MSSAVCIVVENLPVPLDRRVWREALALRDAGYRVSIICPRTETFPAKNETLEGIEIYRHRGFEASTAAGYILEYSYALAVEFFLTWKVFAKTRFRVLQACNPPDTIFLIALFWKLSGVKFIFDHHDLSPELFEAKFGNRKGPLYHLARLLEYCSFRLANICIATNDSFKEVAVNRGGKSPNSVYVVRNCPDIDRFRRPVNLIRNKFGKANLVTYVGFMGTQDGLDLLLQSIEHIVHRENRHDTHFVLIGDGTVLPELKQSVARKRLDEYVSFTGQVSHEEVAAYLSNGDVGVAPDPKNAMNDHSTMVKILEYMAFRLPVVLFDLKEGRHIAGPAALYATPNDPVDFAAKITTLLDNPQLREELGGYGRDRIEQKLNWKVEKASLIEAYAAALQ
jgi:glycosyltransferase involved in cell wall biosynthesis